MLQRAERGEAPQVILAEEIVSLGRNFLNGQEVAEREIPQGPGFKIKASAMAGGVLITRTTRVDTGFIDMLERRTPWLEMKVDYAFVFNPGEEPTVTLSTTTTPAGKTESVTEVSKPSPVNPDELQVLFSQLQASQELAVAA